MKKTLLALFVAVLFAQPADAAIIITVGGPHNLLANTAGQQIDILISSDAGDPLIQGSNLRVQLGDGVAVLAEPVFTGVPGTQDGFSITGSIFDVVGSTVGGQGPVAGAPMVIDASTTVPAAVIGNGVFMSVFVDTTGFAAGSFALNMGIDGFGDTQLLDVAGGVINGVVIVNGSVTIGAVPEPGSLAVFGVLACAALIRRRRA